MIWTVAKKELRGYFNSAVAVIFLAAFLAVALYTFFWREKFFARGLADLRPLFEWMPKLLIILVSALAMRLWADERRTGTLEVLLTLPVPRWQLVRRQVRRRHAADRGRARAHARAADHRREDGQPRHRAGARRLPRRAAAVGRVPVDRHVRVRGDRQPDRRVRRHRGPVRDPATPSAATARARSAGSLGTGARFESVARGVLDLRDLAYYGGIMAIGIALNVLLLGIPTWGRGARARGRRLGAILAVGLVAANAIALDLWLAPVTPRADRSDRTTGRTACRRRPGRSCAGSTSGC